VHASTTVSTRAAFIGARYSSKINRVAGCDSQSSSTSETNNGAATAVITTSGCDFRNKFWYAALWIVPCVPIIPTRKFRVPANAASTPGAITPITGTFASCCKIPNAWADAVLHATTTAFTP